ncbi:MAG: hypothetical protein E7Z90_00915 [Cyanobacteria bacterium SIG29]|nr:hypothetical protein [Cyanobacteria bacterium SIG29]
MKISIYKYLISAVCLTLGLASYATTYASLSPVPTEIIYALNAEENLVGVSTTCNFPEETKEKPIIGDTYFVNMEMMVKLKPDYLFSMSSAKPMLGQLSQTKTKPIYFEFTKIEEIYDAINYIAKLTNTEENAPKLIESIKTKVEQNRTKNPKKILYIVQTEPLITIGEKSFITDIIEKSGHKSVTADIDHYYPNITLEYAMKMSPDIVIVCFPTEMNKIKKLLPNSKFIYLTENERDIINRSGPRVYEAVKLFANL